MGCPKAKGYKGLWVAPGSPYKNRKHVLEAIRYNRVYRIPTLGNCGGFQHTVLEFARKACGLAAADHEETHPDTAGPEISKLACSLVAQQEALELIGGTLLFDIIGKKTLLGKYFCSYGISNRYREILQAKGLQPTAFAADGAIRALNWTIILFTSVPLPAGADGNCGGPRSHYYPVCTDLPEKRLSKT